MNSDISIYVPAFNAEKTIEKCITSILHQTLKPSKILIINDASTDNTFNIINKFKNNHIKIINNKTNLGLSESMNIAVSVLDTRFIGKIDADVELDFNWLKILISEIKKENATLIGGKMYEKYLNNKFNLWRSRRIGQNWGEKNIVNPKFIFGCNNILDTSRINKSKYRTDLEYFKTNGEDIEFSNYLKKNNQKLYYCSTAVCYHLQNDNGKSLSDRYWRYIHYGDGLKKRNLFKTCKNILRQFKKTLKWSFNDILHVQLRLIIVNFIILYYFAIIDLKHYKKNLYK